MFMFELSMTVSSLPFIHLLEFLLKHVAYYLLEFAVDSTRRTREMLFFFTSSRKLEKDISTFNQMCFSFSVFF
ncbi:hypothetical protein ES332_D09G204700v1 [Gossypium tomentosum]|uniref:Uncharacterized protein n=1 Tax=Gossypium tomentosum TaxID=34277 RepID=A0A5D2JKG4_GOSTO|nr:hypothetical protein ES332_D09G204700v1 [Gossypium tomentosum]